MSIRLRLTLWYGTLFAIILFLVILFNYAFHTRGHYDDVDRILMTSASHAAAEAVSGQDAPHIVAGSAAFDVIVRLYDASGRLQETSPGASVLPPVDPRALLQGPSLPPFDPVAGLVPAMAHSPAMPHAGRFSVLADSGQRWRTYLLPLERDAETLGYLESVTSLEQLDASIQAYRLALLAIGLSGFGGALLASYVIASRALRPVAQMVDAAEVITRSHDMSRRITSPPQHDELGHLAATFNTMLASLEEAARAQQRFIADASHELRAPLTAILGNLELIRRQRGMSAADRDEALAEATREADRLSRLVGDLLALARADAGMPLKQQTVDLDVVVLDAFRAARQLAGGHTMRLDPFEPVQLTGDADRLKQLVLILIDNALKYTPDTGCVTLGLRRTAVGAELLVRDTGVGIAPTDLEHVFDRFYRADPARGRDPGGTGLGLAIAKWIAEQHHGTIAIESSPDHGTLVRACLPATIPA